jgi:hypothetical protein
MIDLRKKQEAYQVNGLGTINYIVPLTFEGDECTYYEIFSSRRTAERSLSRRGMYDEVLTFRQVAKAYPKYFKY